LEFFTYSKWPLSDYYQEYNRKIQHQYNKAFKNAGLDNFSGTHTLRHSMATIARDLTGSIDAVQALTGHKSSRLAEHYAGLSHSAQLKALNCVEKMFLN